MTNRPQLGLVGALTLLPLLGSSLYGCSGEDDAGDATTAGAGGSAPASGGAGGAGGAAGKATGTGGATAGAAGKGGGSGAGGKGAGGGAAGASSTGGASAGKGGAGGSSAGSAGKGGGSKGGAGGAGGTGTAGQGTGGVGTGGSGTAGTGAGGSPTCEAFGAYGVPTSTFTIPTPSNGLISYPDVQKSFPGVDWMTIDRLYIPAGKYKSVQLGNLPTRDAATPLVITNLGGQVQVGPNDPGGNFIWAMTGGANWVLTGRYDADSKTGDAAFPGHRCGDYGGSRGKYGFLSDDAFAVGQYLHMGLAITGATRFELEFLEVTRSGFAGIRLLNQRAAGDPPMPMENVKVHDTYVHDTASEGYYFGWTGAPPSNLLPGLQIYNNRIIRTGSETLQIQDLGDGAHVHHNVFAFGALHWLDNFGNYQDNGTQVLTREGTIELDHNIVMGGAGTLLNFFSAPETGDGARNVTFHDNYFADTRDLGAYLNGTSDAPSSFTFANNYFRGMDFSYTTVNPMATDPGVIFGINGGHKAPISFTDNVWESSRLLTYGLAVNGTKANVTATGNTSGTVVPVAYVASGYPGSGTEKLTIWGATATLAPGMPPIDYAIGDLVMYDAQLYQATAASSGLVPDQHPEAWTKLPLPIDDLRAVAGSPYASFGMH